MKTFLLSVSLLISASTLFAQKNAFGVFGGAGFHKIVAKYENEKVSSDRLLAPQAGFLVDLSITKHFSIQPGIAYIGRGGKYSESGYKEKLYLHELEIPVNFFFTMPTSAGKFFVGGGPGIGFAIAGQDKYREDGSDWESEDVLFGNNAEEDDIRSLSVSMNAVIGFEFKKPFFIAVTYNQGVNNRLPKANAEGYDGYKATTNYFGLRVGYFFRKG